MEGPESNSSKHAEPSRTARWIVPPAASLAVHAILLAGVAAVSYEVSRPSEPPRPQRVTLAAPIESTPDPRDTPEPIRERRDEASSSTRDPAALLDPTGALPAPQAITRALERAPTPVAPPPSAPTRAAETLTSPTNANTPTVRFAAVDAAPARTVVFVVDVSGAVATSLTYVREQLLRSIDALSPTQRFQVVVFPGPDNTAPVRAPIARGKLALATRANKQTVADWITGFRPRGVSAPILGLREGLALKPDLLMLITRSIERTGPDAAWGAGLQETMVELDRLNPINPRTTQRRTSIAAVQLLDDDPTGIMRTIAALHGQGIADYRVVTANMLAAPDEAPAGAVASDPEGAIEAATRVVTDLEDSGVSMRLFQGLPDASDRASASAAGERALSMLRRAPADDPRAEVIRFRAATLMSPALPREQTARVEAALLADPNGDAWRRLALIDAYTRANDLDRARTLAVALLTDLSELPVTAATRARLAATMTALGVQPVDPPLLLEEDPYWILALAEARSVALVRSGESDPFFPLIELRDRALADGSQGWVRILDDRIARAAALRPQQIRHAPDEVRVRIASEWARASETRDQGQAELAELAASDSTVAPDALWELGLLQVGTGTNAARLEASGTLADLARRFPDHPRAGDAMAGAVSYASDADPSTRRSLLKFATDEFPGRMESDLWRLALADLVGDVERLDVLEPIESGTRESTLARERYAQTASAILTGDPETDAPVLTRAARYLLRHNDPGARAWLARAGAAQLSRNPETAFRLANAALELAPGESTSVLLVARAELELGRIRDAGDRLAELVARLDADADHGRSFWHAWTLLLESGAADAPDTALAHLARLELLDPALGGPPWNARLRTVRARLGP